MARLRTFAPLLLALPLLLAGCDQVRELVGGSKNDAPARASGRAVRVTTVELTPQTVEIERELTGRTTAYRWAEVRPEVSGILKELCFTEGAMVKEGDVLYRIEPDTYKAALNKARADLASAEANLKVTRRTEVRAPISGRITISNFTVGALLTANQTSPLATIYQTDPMYVELSQSSDDLYALKKQMGEDVDVENINPSLIRATLTMADGSSYSSVGHLNFTGVDVNRNTNTITLRAEFPNPGGELLPGLFVNARVIMGQDPRAILVPQKAVLRDLQGKPYVYLVKDGKAERRSITLSRAIGTDWHVIDGLHLGEKIILNGVNNVRAGMAVEEVTQSDAEKAAQTAQPAGGHN